MNTRRRLVLALGAGTLAPFAAFAQPRKTIHRIGVLGTGSQANGATLYGAFAQELKSLGYVEGKTLAFEYRFANGNLNTLPTLAAELMQKKVDVIFAPNSPSVQAAQKVAGATPIVFAAVSDPVERRFVTSMTQPGGNITGITSSSPQLILKRLQVLKATFPKVSHLAVAISREFRASTQLEEIQRTAKGMGIEVLPIEIRARRSFDEAADVLRKWKADAFSCLETSVNYFNREVLAEFSAKMKMPAIFTSKDYAEAGGLMSYGANSEAAYRHAAVFVDKILKGAKPGALAVEPPAKFELIVNTKTAKTLGIVIPQAILQQADQLIA